MTKKAKLQGNRIDFTSLEYFDQPEVASRFELKDYIEVSRTRSKNKTVTIEFDDTDLLALQFTDNTEWIGHPEDVQEIYNEQIKGKRSSVEEDYLFEIQISSNNQERGFVKQAFVKVFSVFKKKKDAAQLVAQELGELYDKKVQPVPGLFKIDAAFRKITFTTITKSRPCLVFLHGTLSSTHNAFGAMTQNGTWDLIFKKYHKNVLALEHHTISKSPLENALDFLEAIPKNCTFDLISHSRGGLIADILAKCDSRNKEGSIGFSENELLIVEKNDPLSHGLMLKINDEASSKNIKINKVIRVACPSSGTTILSRRIDHFFNLFLNAISLSLGIQNPLYKIAKSFLLDIVSQKENPESLPGLNSMMPESLFQKMLNSTDTDVVSELYTISGDAEVGGINFDSLKVILANLFYWEANDLVVDTNRMVHGVKRKDAIYTFLSQSSDTNHFNYFKNADSTNAIVQALTGTTELIALEFNKQIYSDGKRGILLDLFSLDRDNFEPDEITRDVVILLPGIMGSTLAIGEKDYWVQMPSLNKGAIVNHLDIAQPKVIASGVISKFYSKFGHYLSSDYDVITIAFDWRDSLSKAAKLLDSHLNELMDEHDVNIHIVAHSMGGLVARQCMIDYQATWTRFINRSVNKFVMLGTPWLGSYLIMEVLTGHSRRVKQLAAIDFKHDRKELLEIFWKYPGVFELLPIEENGNRDFANPKFWKDLDKECNLKHMPNPDSYQASLSHFKKYKKSVLKFLKGINSDTNFFKNIYYVCGSAEETVFDYKFKNRFLSDRKKLIYEGTPEGDGSVTWKTGIPKELLQTSNLYYTNTTHGDLANDPKLFDGITDILKKGSTNKLNTNPPRKTGKRGNGITEIHSYAAPLINSNAVENALFDIKKRSEPEPEEINIKVVNGDLEYARFPVMVGHFHMDLILSAEKALDEYLGNRLSQRLDIGYYPGRIGESEVFFNLNTEPKGAIVCGLGSTDTLTTFLLAQTVKFATLKYAMFMRDNYTLLRAKEYAHGISCIIMGIGYGKLAIEDSLKGIVLGITAANEYIEQTKEGLQSIKEVEILNYYESIASQAYYSLSKIAGGGIGKDKRLSINLEKGIQRRAGRKKKQLFAENSYSWWYNLHITCIYGKVNPESEEDEIIGFKYYSSKGLARVEEKMIGIGMSKIESLLVEASKTAYWDKRFSKALFEMVIPNSFKNVFRNQGNIVIKTDKCAAKIPWELLHDIETDDTPMAVTSGFIRQLVTNKASYHKEVSFANNNILVVGDPDYQSDDLEPLPAAKAEAEWVTSQFRNLQYQLNPLINSSSNTILKELYNSQYKIMHFAGHGLYDPQNGNVGIAIGPNICIDAAMINQMGYTPEFIFINCCYSGTIEIKEDVYNQKRYELAANVGTQLIEMGVKAIIIAGWAVDDAAAKTFSETFYKNMFEGYDFGNSIQKARLACYQMHSNTNTWGAYHSYGNQFYKFDGRRRSKTDEVEYVIASQVHIDLDNLLSAIRDSKNDKDTTLRKLHGYLEKVERSNLLDAVVLEKEALIYDELGESELALQKFVALFKHANGNYSIEALEQYCVIKTHNLNRKNLKDDLKEIEFLTLAGKNPNRLNIVANAYKFASLIVNTVKQKNNYLTKSFDYYEMAFLASTDRFNGGYLDALTNMIFLGHILELRGEDKLVNRLKKSKAFDNTNDVESYLVNFYNELEDYDKTDLDLSVMIGMAEASYGLLLFKSEFKPDIELDIIAKFKYVFGLMYSPRYINLEIKHINFLLAYIDDEVIKKQLKKVRTEVENFINKKTDNL